MTYSIVIPSYKKLNELLEPCLKSITDYTSTDYEIVVVGNGCDKEEFYKVVSKYPMCKPLWFEQALGYTKAVNEGIKAASGEYIVLLNDDTKLLPQAVNHWLTLLVYPFRKDPKVGITGPVKFHWDCGGITREAMAFWLVMIPKKIFDELGLLDEIFSPGMGEDGDFSIRVTEAGYKLISVPNDESLLFSTGTGINEFPIWHQGNGTFGENHTEKEKVIMRNNKILEERWGKKTGPSKSLLEKYEHYCKEVIDLNEHMPTLMRLAKDCNHITEFGTRFVVSTYAFMMGMPKKLLTYDISVHPNIWKADEIAKENKIEFAFMERDTTKVTIEPTDLLFIDTEHSYKQCKTELALHADKARKYIVFHDTVSYGYHDENSTTGGLMPAINEFLVSHPEWIIKENYHNCNGLMVLERRPKYSIVIPTYNYCNELLKPCIESIIAHTDLTQVEVIVVANGCTDNTREYVESLRHPFKLVWFDEPLGYIKPTNAGIKESKGDFIVLLNNDTILTDQPKNQWLSILESPFANPKVGITGPTKHTLKNWNKNKTVFETKYIPFYCAMIKKEVIDSIGLLDESFGIGYEEDVDFCTRAVIAGYDLVKVSENTGTKYPLVHFGQSTFKHIDFEKKGNALLSKYNVPKCSIVIPTYNHCDDLLKPCLESIIKYTDMSKVEVIVVANGCKDNTREYVESLGYPFKLLWIDDAVGYTKATNVGIRESRGEYVLLLNNDTELLPQSTDLWLNLLYDAFKDPQVGLTGPLQLHDDYADFDVLIFFCVMIKREVFDKIGLLDEIFSPGGGEDIDFTVRANLAGYKSVAHSTTFDPAAHTNVGYMPIWHKDNRTFKDIPEYSREIIKRNGLINCKRYNKNIRLNVGSGGVEFPGYLSVDLYDTRANILMDITKLDFDSNSVTEILASHVFEHLNPYHVEAILKNWFDVLKPGGKLIMEMPDIEALCKRFVTASKGERYYILSAIYGSVNTTNEGGPDNITSPHLFGWWPESLYDYLALVGFRDIVFMEEKIPHPESNLRVEAIKPLN